tara:strand:- start:195 stop:467 length:273 start_codon:yes stop_codon:yes gene_type:complete
MALIEKTIISKIEVVAPHYHVQIREDNQIIDDETNEIKSDGNYHRYVLAPGDDLSGQSADVAAVANAVWTQEIIAAYAEFEESQTVPGIA